MGCARSAPAAPSAEAGPPEGKEAIELPRAALAAAGVAARGPARVYFADHPRGEKAHMLLGLWREGAERGWCAAGSLAGAVCRTRAAKRRAIALCEAVVCFEDSFQEEMDCARELGKRVVVLNAPPGDEDTLDIIRFQSAPGADRIRMWRAICTAVLTAGDSGAVADEESSAIGRSISWPSLDSYEQIHADTAWPVVYVVGHIPRFGNALRSLVGEMRFRGIACHILTERSNVNLLSRHTDACLAMFLYPELFIDEPVAVRAYRAFSKRTSGKRKSRIIAFRLKKQLVHSENSSIAASFSSDASIFLEELQASAKQRGILKLDIDSSDLENSVDLTDIEGRSIAISKIASITSSTVHMIMPWGRAAPYIKPLHLCRLSHIDRERLLDVESACASSRLVLLRAPAVSGTSTLLAHFCRLYSPALLDLSHSSPSSSKLSYLTVGAFAFFDEENKSLSNAIISIYGQLCANVPGFKCPWDPAQVVDSNDYSPLALFNELVLETVKATPRVKADTDHSCVIVLDGLGECDDPVGACQILKQWAEWNDAPTWLRIIVSQTGEGDFGLKANGESIFSVTIGQDEIVPRLSDWLEYGFVSGMPPDVSLIASSGFALGCCNEHVLEHYLETGKESYVSKLTTLEKVYSDFFQRWENMVSEPNDFETFLRTVLIVPRDPLPARICHDLEFGQAVPTLLVSSSGAIRCPFVSMKRFIVEKLVPPDEALERNAHEHLAKVLAKSKWTISLDPVTASLTRTLTDGSGAKEFATNGTNLLDVAADVRRSFLGSALNSDEPNNDSSSLRQYRLARRPTFNEEALEESIVNNFVASGSKSHVFHEKRILSKLSDDIMEAEYALENCSYHRFRAASSGWVSFCSQFSLSRSLAHAPEKTDPWFDRYLDDFSVNIDRLIKRIQVAFTNSTYDKLLSDASLGGVTSILMFEVLSLAKSALRLDARHLPGQILGRISPKLEATDPFARKLVTSASAWVDDSIRNGNRVAVPARYFSGLEPVGSSLRSVIRQPYPVYRIGSVSERMVAAASWDGCLRVIDVTLRKTVKCIHVSKSAILAMDIHPVHNQVILCGTAHGSIAKVDLHNDHSIQIFAPRDTKPSRVNCIKWVDDFDAISGSENGSICMWDTVNGTCKRAVQLDIAILSLCLSIDYIVAGTSGRSIVIFQRGGLNEVARLIGHGGDVTALTSHDNVLYSGSSDKTIRVWNLVTMQQCHVLNNAHFSTVNAISISSDGLLLSASDHVRLFRLGEDTIEAKPLTVYRCRGHCASDAMFLEGRVCTISEDNVLRVWDAPPGGDDERPVATKSDMAITSVAVNRSGRIALVSGLDRLVRVFDTETGGLIRTLQGHTDAVYCCSISGDGQFGATGSLDRTCRIWDLQAPEGRELINVISHKDIVFSVFISDLDDDEKNRLVVTGSYDGARVFQVSTGEALEETLIKQSLFEIPTNANAQVDETWGTALVPGQGDTDVGFCPDLQGDDLRRIGDRVFGPVDNTWLYWTM